MPDNLLAKIVSVEWLSAIVAIIFGGAVVYSQVWANEQAIDKNAVQIEKRYSDTQQQIERVEKRLTDQIKESEQRTREDISEIRRMLESRAHAPN